MLDFKDKLIVVTGAARGIGRGVAFEYAKHGAHIILLDILADLLKETAEDMRKEGYTVYSFPCDLGSDEGVASLGEQIVKEIGVPDILHNNAFWAPNGCLEDIDIAGCRKALDISVLGYLRIIRAFINPMIARKSGWIVNTASPNGITPPASYAEFGLPYNMCKAADISMSQALAAGLKKHGIGVSVIYPDATKTGAMNNGGNAPKAFSDAITEYFKTNGVTPEEAAVDFVEGVRQQKFMVFTYPNFDKILVEYAKNGLDPNGDYSHVMEIHGG
ncbi:3-oxoacyl-reductase [Lepidopterella palustris CBS 459.81]|uniref:3-oxoacyl-reductase n=1 Tax=Lepidopterella palustris CBS 459.81 TaxID=1314670 RepID=A0A8E2EEP7_9PEZI|nr:3-oxoacyl-reductase [Lepidopterella palustris CBS 459.81]